MQNGLLQAWSKLEKYWAADIQSYYWLQKGSHLTSVRLLKNGF